MYKQTNVIVIIIRQEKAGNIFFQKRANNSYLSCSQVGSYQTFYYTFVSNADE